MNITSVSATQIVDTRGKPTIETTLRAGDLTATASVPSGKSTGSHEALELRDPDGGVQTAISNVEGEIATLLTSRDWNTPDEIDEAMIALDGTPNKSRLGANAILSVSIAAQRLFALAEGIPLWKAISARAGLTPGNPRLYLNFMNGGVHAPTPTSTSHGKGTENTDSKLVWGLPFQEYILVVEGKTSSALPIAEEAFEMLGKRLGNVPMGDEGGYAPSFEKLDEPFELLDELVSEFPGTSIAIDAAATELRDGDGYALLGTHYTPEELTTIYGSIVDRFPIHSIEDPFAEDSYSDFVRLTAEIGNRTIVIGDDFTVTNPERIDEALTEHAINGVLIKPNQIGTVGEAIKAVQMTHEAGWATVCSHRSGETDDTFIADFAYGVGAHGIKAGGLGQKERREKYMRLLEIEHEAGME